MIGRIPSVRWQVLLLAALALVGLACEGAGARPGPTPSSRPAGGLAAMAALGDSLTAAYGSCFAPTTCPRNSWSTGDGTRVDSHYRRLRGGNPALRGQTRNHAAPNARVSDLVDQATAAAAGNPDYVTVLVGANDACRTRAEDMTPVETFRRQLDAGLAVLKRQRPQARVLVVSIPDIHRLWEVGRGSRVATKAWSLGMCPALLANATSEAEPDRARRQVFAERVRAYNAQLVAACRAYGPRCRDDGGAVHRIAVTLDMVSAQDFFHPNAAGQNAIAEATYPGQPSW